MPTITKSYSPALTELSIMLVDRFNSVVESYETSTNTVKHFTQSIVDFAFRYFKDRFGEPYLIEFVWFNTNEIKRKHSVFLKLMEADKNE